MSDDEPIQLAAQLAASTIEDVLIELEAERSRVAALLKLLKELRASSVSGCDPTGTLDIRIAGALGERDTSPIFRRTDLRFADRMRLKLLALAEECGRKQP